MMVYSQAILGTAGGGLADSEMLEKAHRNFEKMVHVEGLSPLDRGQLLGSNSFLRRPDLVLLLWRQAHREDPESKEIQRELAEAALAAGHWAEAASIAEELLDKNPKDERALKVRGKAQERARDWLAARTPSKETEARGGD